MSSTIPPIRYISNNNNDYVTTSGGNEPYTQTLNVNDAIDKAVISTNIELGEELLPRVISISLDSEHPYKVYQNGEWVIYTVTHEGVPSRVYAQNMPKRLVGWKARNKNTQVYDNFNNTVLTDDIISKYAVSNEIALYGNWENISLIRVIVFIPYYGNDMSGRCAYTSSIAPGTSYTPNIFNPYANLSDNYKEVVDYFGEEDKRAIMSFPTNEVATGDGCTVYSSNHAHRYPTYFSVKKNDKINFVAQCDSGSYIPNYVMVNDPESVGGLKPLYRYFTTNALRCDITNWDKDGDLHYFTSPYFLNEKLCWASEEMHNTETDLTIMVPLVVKPILTVEVLYGNDSSYQYFAYVGNSQTQPPYKTKEYYMPSDVCQVYTRTTNPNATFNGWFIGGSTPVSTNQNYSFRINYSTHIVARWTPGTPPQPTHPTVELSYLLAGSNWGDDKLSGSDLPQYSVDGGSNWTPLTTSAIVSFQHTSNSDIILRCPLTAIGEHDTDYSLYIDNVTGCNGFKEYFGMTRNFLEDTNLGGSGNFSQGGSYDCEGITTPYIGNRITLSNLSNDSSYKIYAFYYAIQR